MPHSVQQLWELFAKSGPVMAKETPQHQWMRLAFHAGAFSIIEEMKNVPFESPEASNVWAQLIQNECKRLFAMHEAAAVEVAKRRKLIVVPGEGT